MKPGYAKNLNSKDHFALWNQSPSINIFTVRLDKIYTFGVKKTGYRVEAIAMWYPRKGEPCWGLTVHHRDWAQHLGELERLPPGSGAEWVDPVKTFFPDNGTSSKVTVDSEHLAQGNGTALLIDKLMQLSKIVNSGSEPARTFGGNLALESLVDI